MMRSRIAALLAAISVTGFAQAADFGLYGTAGTVGFGGGLAATFNDHFGARIGYTSYEHTVDDIEEGDLVLDGKAKIGGLQALLDWYPFGGGFRLSAGAMENASLTASARPIGGAYTLNGTTYTTAELGDASGVAEYESISPYAGIGFGRALSRNGRLGFSADLGVVFTGTPDIELNATCRVPNATLCAQIDTNLRAEEAELRNEADELKYWPVLSIGVSYKF
jgi:hypothetical protein